MSSVDTLTLFSPCGALKGSSLSADRDAPQTCSFYKWLWAIGFLKQCGSGVSGQSWVQEQARLQICPPGHKAKGLVSELDYSSEFGAPSPPGSGDLGITQASRGWSRGGAHHPIMDLITRILSQWLQKSRGLSTYLPLPACSPQPPLATSHVSGMFCCVIPIEVLKALASPGACERCKFTKSVPNTGSESLGWGCLISPPGTPDAQTQV